MNEEIRNLLSEEIKTDQKLIGMLMKSTIDVLWKKTSRMLRMLKSQNNCQSR